MNVQSLHRIERLNYMLGGVLIASMAFVLDRPGALGVLVGVIISSANFTVMRKMVQSWLRQAPDRRGSSSFFMVPKMTMLMGAVALSLIFLPISAGGLVIGFSVFLLSIGIETVRYISSPRPSDVPAGADDTKS